MGKAIGSKQSNYICQVDDFISGKGTATPIVVKLDQLKFVFSNVNRLFFSTDFFGKLHRDGRLLFYFYD